MNFYQPGWDRHYTDDVNYYHGTLAADQAAERLQGDHECDVCIIGAGFAGLATAYFLADAGLKVTVLERHDTGWGASGRNGGQLLPGWSVDIDVIARKKSPAFARRIWDISVDGVDIVKKIIADHKLDCDYRPGAAYLGYKDDHKDCLQRLVDVKTDIYSYPVEFKSGGDVAAMMGTDYYTSAAFMPEAGHLNPYKYIKGLANILRKKGVSIFEYTPAEAIIEDKDRYLIHTPGARVKAGNIVLCGGAYLGALVPALRHKYILARCGIIATGKLDDPEAIIPADIAACEYTIFMHFFRKTAEGCFMFGGGDALKPNVSSIAMQKKIMTFLTGHMVEVFPRLEGVEIQYKWGGYLDVSSSRLPNIGRLGHGVYYASGFSGHGINNTHVAGKMVADALLGRNEDYRFFSSIKNLTFPGRGYWDSKYLALGMAYERLMERLFPGL